jgi:hypothetical protein
MRKYGWPETLAIVAKRYGDLIEIQRAVIREVNLLLDISQQLHIAFHALLADEGFRTLLRAEDIDRVPGVLLNPAAREKAMLRRRVPNATEVLRSRKLSPHVLRQLNRVVPERREEFARLMITSGCCTSPYVRSLICATDKQLLVSPEHPPRTLIMKPPQRAAASKEISDLAAQLRKLSGYGNQDLIALFVSIRYAQRLLSNRHVRRYLKRELPEVVELLTKTVRSYQNAEPILMSAIAL